MQVGKQQIKGKKMTAINLNKFKLNIPLLFFKNIKNSIFLSLSFYESSKFILRSENSFLCLCNIVGRGKGKQKEISHQDKIKYVGFLNVFVLHMYFFHYIKYRLGFVVGWHWLDTRCPPEPFYHLKGQKIPFQQRITREA